MRDVAYYQWAQNVLLVAIQATLPLLHVGVQLVPNRDVNGMTMQLRVLGGETAGLATLVDEWVQTVDWYAAGLAHNVQIFWD